MCYANGESQDLTFRGADNGSKDIYQPEDNESNQSDRLPYKG